MVTVEWCTVLDVRWGYVRSQEMGSREQTDLARYVLCVRLRCDCGHEWETGDGWPDGTWTPSLGSWMVCCPRCQRSADVPSLPVLQAFPS